MANSETDTQATALGQMDRFQTFFGRVEAKASFLLAIDLALLGSVAVAIPVKDLRSARS